MMRTLITGTGLVLGTVGCWWQIRQLGDVRFRLPEFYLWFAIAFGLYLTGLWLVHHVERVAHARGLLGLVMGTAVAARLFLLPTTPTLSDDIYRYQWDGRVQLAGIDPYAYPPNDARLASLRDTFDGAQAPPFRVGSVNPEQAPALLRSSSYEETSPKLQRRRAFRPETRRVGEPFAHINVPHLRTVYPPLTQLAFRLGARLDETLTAQKLIFVCAELLTVLSLLFILWRRGRSLLWVVAYAWHPLVILEIAGSGHNDALGIAMLWLGVAAWEARRWGAASVAWAAAFLSKFTSLLLVPWWWTRRQQRMWLVVFLALSLLPMVLHPTAIVALVESLGAMTTRVESNASLYLVLVWVTRSMVASRVLAAGLGVGFLVWWARRQSDPIRFCLGVFTVAALLSPVLHPWYLVWLIPCFCFVRSPSLVLLTATVVLAYTVWPGRLADGRWEIPMWARLIEYVPVCLLGMWELWSKRSCVWGLSFQLATKPKLSVRS